MKDSEIKTFYDEINNISSFSRIRKTFELTNNLDPYLLYHLKRDFTLHHINKLKVLIVEKKHRTEEDIEAIFGDVLTNYDFENYLESFDFSFEGEFEQECLYNMYDEINDYIFELEDLQKYSDSSKKNVPTRATPFDFELDSTDKEYEGMSLEEWFEIQDQKELEINEKSNVEVYKQPIDEPIEEPVSVSISMKIIYLEKLGIIDYLKKEEPFNMSINSLAKVLSRIIGAKAVSVQPYLNAMLSKNVNEKNNPLNSESNVETVEYHLSKMGFKLRKKSK